MIEGIEEELIAENVDPIFLYKLFRNKFVALFIVHIS